MKLKLKALKEFAKENDIKVSKKDTEKTLAKKVREKWEEDDVEMDCLCPTCEEEIPDIDTCPFCGASFEEDNGNGEESGETEDKKEKESKKKSKGKDKKASKKKSKDKEKAKKKGKAKGRKRGPRAGSLNFQDAVEAVSSLVSKSGVETKERGNYTAYFYKGVRLFHIAKTTRTYTMLTNLEGLKLKLKDGEYELFEEEKLESGHMAKSVGLLKTTSLAEVKSAASKLIALGKEVASEKETSKKSTKKSKKVVKKSKKKAKRKKKK